MESNFPRDFYWGAATSAHQVEGGNKNDWSEFERQTANGKAQMARGSEWPEYILEKYPSPLQEKNYISGRATDHYNNFAEDFDIAKSLGHNAHRFSIEWSRVEPEEGKFDEGELEHYRAVVQALRKRNLEPFVTLWHWSLPFWLVRRGGWETRESIGLFERYCERVARIFGDSVVFFITLNEPALWCSNAYLWGNFPPGKKNPILALKVFSNLVRAHRAAARRLKSLNGSFQVGVTQNTGWLDSAMLRPVYYFINFFFLDRVAGMVDFIGVDYYRKIPVFGNGNDEKIVMSDIGWEVYPRGLYGILQRLGARYRKPIFVTENGVADAEDTYRGLFIQEHVYWMKEAMRSGVDIRGYFHWSLLDNFEWENGFWPRFGLIEVDYQTFERKIRPSALVYKQIIAES